MDSVERKKQGLPYCYDDPALLGDQHIYQNKMCEYNLTLPTETEKRQDLLKEVFAEIGDGREISSSREIWGDNGRINHDWIKTRNYKAVRL